MKSHPVSLTIGLVKEDPSWVSLLDSEGLSWVGGHLELSAQDKPVFLIFPADTPLEHFQQHSELIYSGATAICELGVWPDDRVEELKSKRMPYDNSNFSGLESITCENSVEIETGRFGLGSIVRLPFTLNSLWANGRIDRRFVSIGNGQNIYEDMAAIVKKNVRRVVVDVLKSSFFERGLPYLHKWYYPESSRSVFCLRGDADGGPRENFKRWLNTLRPYASSTSVFFCTSKYENKQDLIADAALAGFEVGSHNHWHIIFPDGLTNKISLSRAQKMLTNSCSRPHGFVAPAFFWHRTMYKNLEAEDYQYSSCFGLSHDSLPYFPVIENRLGSVLEIPFHCLGDRFPRFNIDLDSETTINFFSSLIKKKYDAAEPMLIYGHPDIANRMGTAPQLLKLIAETALSNRDVYPLQLSEYAAWWRKRNNCTFECSYDENSSRLKLQADSVALTEKLKVRVEFPDGSSYLMDPDTCPADGLTRDAMQSFSPLKLPASCDVGEVVYQGPDQTRSFLSWQKRRTIKRYVRAYSRVYLPFLSRSPDSF